MKVTLTLSIIASLLIQSSLNAYAQTAPKLSTAEIDDKAYSLVLARQHQLGDSETQLLDHQAQLQLILKEFNSSKTNFTQKKIILISGAAATALLIGGAIYVQKKFPATSFAKQVVNPKSAIQILKAATQLEKGIWIKDAVVAGAIITGFGTLQPAGLAGMDIWMTLDQLKETEHDLLEVQKEISADLAIIAQQKAALEKYKLKIEKRMGSRPSP